MRRWSLWCTPETGWIDDPQAATKDGLSTARSQWTRGGPRASSGNTLVPAFGGLEAKLDPLDPHGARIWQMDPGKSTKYRDNITGQPLKDELVRARGLV